MSGEINRKKKFAKGKGKKEDNLGEADNGVSVSAGDQLSLLYIFTVNRNSGKLIHTLGQEYITGTHNKNV